MLGQKSRKRPAPGSSVITSFFTREKDVCVSSDSRLTSELEACELSRNSHESPSEPASKKKKERDSGFDPKWKSEFPWVQEIDGGIKI